MTARQLTFDLPIREALGREDFIVTPTNAHAVAMLEGDVPWPNGKLALTGPEASGKSHLVQVWARQRDAAVIAAFDLRGADIRALAGRGNVAVEDVPRIAGQREAEASLFHLHNLIAEEGGMLLFTGRGTPSRWPLALADLASRLRAAMQARIEAPDDMLLGALLAKQFADRQMRVGGEVIAYLVARMTRNAAAAQSLARGLDRLSLTEKRPVTVALARRALDTSDWQTGA